MSDAKFDEVIAIVAVIVVVGVVVVDGEIDWGMGVDFQRWGRTEGAKRGESFSLASPSVSGNDHVQDEL
jgi:hypothetical protein